MKTLQPFLVNGYSWRRSFADVTVSVIKEPASTMQSSDDGRDMESLLSTLQVVTANGFGIPLENRSADGVRKHIEQVDGLAFLHTQDRVLGFASALTHPEDGVFYLHGVVIDSSWQGKGRARALVRELVRSIPCGKMAFTTQNPQMYGFMRSFCDTVYPSPGMSAVPEHLHALGEKLVRNRTGVFDPSTFVMRDLYSKCLYERLPTSSDPVVNKWFERTLECKEGTTRNAFLFVGENVNPV
ncbi:GNAT family N-acetyltransferase [Candidatus Kaiserbacteria bacterium]|nr:GNAT family N-acetyltransferase [Candidatus Kaiserbacteria bacterium]